MMPPYGAWVTEAMLNVGILGIQWVVLDLDCGWVVCVSVASITQLRGWEVYLSTQLRLIELWAADVTTVAALPQNRVETLIGSQGEFDITLNKDILLTQPSESRLNETSVSVASITQLREVAAPSSPSTPCRRFVLGRCCLLCLLGGLKRDVNNRACK